MGYRTRLGRIAKSEKEKYAGKTVDEVIAMIEAIDPNASPYRHPEHQQLYEIGKYAEYTDDRSPFYDFDIMEECEGEFDILSKEGLKKIILDYHQKNKEWLDELMAAAIIVCGDNPPPEADISRRGEESPKHKIFNYIRSMQSEWARLPRMAPYFLDEPKDRSYGMIARSWKYEYAIFNLVYIYRTFDWENDYLIYSGW